MIDRVTAKRTAFLTRLIDKTGASATKRYDAGGSVGRETVNSDPSPMTLLILIVPL